MQNAPDAGIQEGIVQQTKPNQKKWKKRKEKERKTKEKSRDVKSFENAKCPQFKGPQKTTSVSHTSISISQSDITSTHYYTHVYSTDRSLDPPDRRCVKLRRILSPQAELSSECMTSRTLIALFWRE